jgi:hypothetical protein
MVGMPGLGFSELATKIPVDVGFDLWRSFERRFFAENRYFFGSLRPIYTINFLPQLREEFIKILKDFLIPRMMLQNQAGGAN